MTDYEFMSQEIKFIVEA